MTSTTIKVSTETRDRLKAQAAAAQVTLGEHLTRLADLADRDARFAALGRAIARIPADEMAQYARETETWETTELSDTGD